MVTNTYLPSYSCDSSDQKTLFTKTILHQKTFFTKKLFYKKTYSPKIIFKTNIFHKKIQKKYFSPKTILIKKLCLPKKFVTTIFSSHPKKKCLHQLFFLQNKSFPHPFFSSTKKNFTKSLLFKRW